MAEKKLSLDQQSFTINYEIIHPKNKKDFIVLHGWGSHKEIMKQAFSKILPDFRHIYIDMPGFGKSSNDYVLTTQEYSTIINHFLKTLHSDKKIITGHSFGGKVATLLAPQLLVLLSNSGIPTPKPLQVRLKIKLFKLLKNIGGTKLFTLFASKDVAGMSQNMYETFKNVVDEDFSSIFENYSDQTLIFWGEHDSATPLSSGKRIAQLMKNSTFYPLEGDHYFFLQHPLFIEKAIEKEFNG
ncbi:MAG: alpha/beta hydrolase [Epsilonproteobacteria bacterium]|nr:alpha/beta hydrolase [Campylobacterota bacterium]